MSVDPNVLMEEGLAEIENRYAKELEALDTEERLEAILEIAAQEADAERTFFRGD